MISTNSYTQKAYAVSQKQYTIFSGKEKAVLLFNFQNP